MTAAIALRADHGADDLRTLAKASRDARRTRRLLALAAIYVGSSRSDAAGLPAQPSPQLRSTKPFSA